MYHISEMPFDFLDMLENTIDHQYDNISDSSQFNSVYQTYMRDMINKQEKAFATFAFSAKDIVFFYKQYHILKKMHWLNNNDQWQNYFAKVSNSIHCDFNQYIKKINLTDFIDKKENIKNTLIVLNELTEDKLKIIDDIFSQSFDCGENSGFNFDLKNYYKEQKMDWIISNDFVDFIRDSNLNQKSIGEYFGNFYHKTKLNQNEDILIENLKSMEDSNKEYFLKYLFSETSLNMKIFGKIKDTNNSPQYKKDKAIYDRVAGKNDKSFEHFVIDHIHYKKNSSKLKQLIVNAPDSKESLKQSINKHQLQLKNANQLNQMLNIGIPVQNIDTNYLKNNLEVALKKQNKSLLKRQCDILVALHQNNCHEIINSVVTKDSLNVLFKTIQK